MINLIYSIIYIHLRSLADYYWIYILFTILTLKVIPVNQSVGTDDQLTAIGNDIEKLVESGKPDSAANLVIAVSDFLNVKSTDTSNLPFICMFIMTLCF